jgi:hypothetical protein
MTGFCGARIKFTNSKHTPKCPRCEEEDETTLNVFRCKHTGTMDIWTKSVQNLEHWILNNLGHPELVEFIQQMEIKKCHQGLIMWHTVAPK